MVVEEITLPLILQLSLQLLLFSNRGAIGRLYVFVYFQLLRSLAYPLLGVQGLGVRHDGARLPVGPVPLILEAFEEKLLLVPDDHRHLLRGAPVRHLVSNQRGQWRLP